MKIIACILYNVVVVTVCILIFPFYMIGQAISYVMAVIKTLVAGTRNIKKGAEKQDSKEKSDEETDVDEKPCESVFDDMGV